MITRLSALAASFPTVEVAVDDILRWPYRVDGRDATGIDCLGVVIEVYRRAGLGLPDPASSGLSREQFSQLFEAVAEPTNLFDLIYRGAGAGEDGGFVLGPQHVMVVTERGVALSARQEAGVFRMKVSHLKGKAGVLYYRVRPEVLPT